MYSRMKTLSDVLEEGVTSVREWEPGIYVVQTNHALDVLKSKVRSGEINAGSFAFVPGYVKELNELTKTPEGRKELLKRVWGDDWEKHA